MPQTSDHYLVTWRDPRNGEIAQLRAREIRDSSLGLTFVAITGFLWESSSPIVNPAEEALQRRFESTKTLHLSIHTILSIEEVGADHKGLSFEQDRANLLVFPPDKRV
jgi:hypothetical protein